MKTSAGIALIALLAGCASQATHDSSAPAAAPAPGAAASTLGSARSGGPSSSVASSNAPDGAYRMPQARSIYYDYDKAEIKPTDVKLIEAHAQYLKEHPGVKVRVEGNADERGSAEYNLALGQRRADSVSKRLELLGIAENRVEAVSYGKEKPKVVGHDESAWSQNRRSDINYK
jgi:peptidoglycan-associated lipoprotein